MLVLIDHNFGINYHISFKSFSVLFYLNSLYYYVNQTLLSWIAYSLDSKIYCLSIKKVGFKKIEKEFMLLGDPSVLLLFFLVYDIL